MRFEESTSFSMHIMDGSEFLGRLVGPMITTRNQWEYDPSNIFLSERQMDEIKTKLRGLNAKCQK